MKKHAFLRIIIFLFVTLAAASQTLYWENPLDASDPNLDCRFPVTVSGTDRKALTSAAFWQEIDKDNHSIYLSASSTKDTVNWTTPTRFAGPFSYSGDIPNIYSAAINTRGTIAVAALSGINEISVYTSTDAVSFSQVKLPAQELPLVGPRIFCTSSGYFILFATLAKEESFSLVYSTSRDGKSWSNFTPFSFSYPNASNPLVPYVTSVKGGDLLVFQAHYSSGNRYSFQLFSSRSSDNGKTWTTPVMITGAMDDFHSYNNQRPVAISDGINTYLAWERSYYTSVGTTIYVSTLNQDGTLGMDASSISITNSCLNPVLFNYNGSIYLLWADSDSKNNRAYLSKRLELFWDDPSVMINGVDSSVYPVTANREKELGFIWQHRAKANSFQIQRLIKDASSPAPIIIPQTFEDGKGGNLDRISAIIQEGTDSSGVKGFSVLWTNDPNAEPENTITNLPEETLIEGDVPEDGYWYFKVKQVDYANNWSKTSTVSYRKDTVAPKIPLIKPIELDENNLAKSNTFEIEWQPDQEDNDIEGYTWSLQYVDSIPTRLAVNARHPLRLSSEEVKEIVDSLYEKNAEKIEQLKEPPKYIRGDSLTLKQKIQNARNGLYVFSIAAIDDVGNIGEYESIQFILNKYIPQTYISALNPKLNIFGDLDLEIYGGGFTYEGTISEVYIDLDGEAPYDYILTQENGDFTVESDNRISGINIKTPKANSYYIGLLHTDRGLYMTKEKTLEIGNFGTVKGNKTFSFIPKWITDFFHGKISFDLSFIIILLMVIFAVVAVIMITRGLTGTAREAVLIQAEIKALIQGDIMPEEKKKQTESLKRKGSGLRLKLTAYTMTLILVLVLALILALGYIMINREEQTRAEGLKERVNVILDAMASGAKINLPNASSNLLALGDLTEESEALSDANFAVITGRGNNEEDINLDYIWATNDVDVSGKINTESLSFGSSRFVYENIDEIAQKCISLNKEAANEVDFISTEISQLTAEGITLAGKDDEESIARRTEISEITTQLNNRVNRALDNIATRGIGSYPDYDSTKIDKENTTFMFYKPVLYRHGNDQTYVNGIVFVEISTDALVQDMKDAKMAIIKLATAVVVAALILGLVFAFLLSSIIVSPVNKLARHVAMIRDTEDKEKLAGKDIIIKSRDEIGMLGDTINEMTHSLVDAAIQSKNLTFGKEVQSKFIPLQTDELGNSLTYGQLHQNGLDLFSYYAGADELSGDYFDYKKLDENHYAIIKCDVSGHGVPAALIMVEVATLFLNAFSNWSMSNPAQGTNLKPVVGQINDLIESRGFKGRFAAFTLAILNAQTGVCWFCNAGDNIVHVYDGTSMKNKTVTLPETPAAGMFSTDLVDMKGGYKVAKFTLKKDDVLFLYTDGIEEAKRNFRNLNDEIVPCKEKDLNDGDIHLNHKVGETTEELTPERVSEIIECVYAKGVYKLHKMHNPNPEDTYTFDFSTCQGTAEESILALVSIEKVFRMYRSKNTTQEDVVLVDKKIDEFLKQHFVEYSVYCLNHKEIESNKTHILYCGLMEDPQYDDLTLIAIKKT